MGYETEILQELEDEYSGEGEEEYEDSLEGEGWLGALGNVVGSLLGEGEEEFEDVNSFPTKIERENPIRKIYADAMMEHMGELAFEAESEEEAAEHLMPAAGMAANKVLPVAAKAAGPAAKRALPKIAHAVSKTTPHLPRGIGKMTKTLYRNPQTRHLVKTVPAIARRTVGSIARQAAHGKRVTPRTAVKTLARQARHVLANPAHRRHALRRHQNLERKFHRNYGQGIARPHPRYGPYSRYSPYYGYRYGAAGAPSPSTYQYAAPGTYGYSTPGYVAPGSGYQPGVTYGTQPRYGTCTCAPCPTCGGRS
jgi:hypothetical protein